MKARDLAKLTELTRDDYLIALNDPAGSPAGRAAEWGLIAATLGQARLKANTSAGATTCSLDTLPRAAVVGVGWLVFDPYTTECEIRKWTGGTKTAPTFSALTYAHAAEDPVLWLNEPTVNVKWFGATGDGSTDDTAAIQGAWDAMSAGDTLLFPAGTYLISDTLDWTDLIMVTVKGSWANIKTKSGANFSGKAMIDLAGSSLTKVEALKVESTLTSNEPEAGIVLGRTATSPGGNMTLDKVRIEGYFTTSALYNVGSEVSNYYGCIFIQNKAGADVVFLSNDDPAGLTTTDGGHKVGAFIGCSIHNYGGSGGANVVLRGAVQDHSFLACYGVIAPGGYFFETQTSTGGGQIINIVVDNLRIETGNVSSHVNSRVLYVNNTNGVRSSRFSNINTDFQVAYGIPDFLFDIQNTFAWNEISGVQTQSTSKLMNIGAVTFIDNVISYRGVDMVTVDPSASLDDNIFLWTGPDYPFTSTTGNYVQHVINSVLPNPVTWSAGDETPSVGNGLWFITANTSPTTITAFDDGAAGQRIVIFINDNNTTIDFNTGATLYGNGNVDWVPSVGDWMEAWYTGLIWLCAVHEST